MTMQEMTFFITGCLIHAGSRWQLGGLLASPNRRRRILLSVFALFGLLLASVPASADTPVSLYESLAGNINITGTGGTLRTNPDGVNSCSVTNNGTMTLSGIPAGATVRKAYLYWAGSGGDPVGGVPADYNVTFNGTPVTADRTFTANGGSTRYFFGGVKDVTSQVTGNGVYTFADLTVQTADVPGGGPYCSVAVVLSAFSLVVVYDDPAEILHVVNIWEGFQVYYGSSITLTPTNFIAPTPAPVTPLSSRIMVLTWEGDSGNSAPLGGFNENLTFCSPTPCGGSALTDAYNPVNNQFNSTIDIPPSGPFSGINTIWGNDLDMYDITAMIPAAAASAQSVYSSGGDRVILMNQTMSIVNVPVADLAITKSHVGNFTVGVNGVYTLGGITNNGPSDATGTITVTDTLPAGLTYVSAVGTGWACGAAGQIVTCTRPGPLAPLASAPSITLTVSVGAAAYPSVTNTVSVTSGDFDNVAGNSTNVGDPTTVLAPDLSTSTKTWQDLNAGDANPGDVIQYTITLIETGGVNATGVTVTDDIPANVTGFTVTGIPAGSTNSSTGAGTGANGTGYLNIANISVPAGGSVAITFDVTVGAVAPGTPINNTASVANPLGPGAAPVAVTVIVSQSSIPQTGNKPLYLYGGAASPYTMSRTPTPGAPTTAAIAGGGGVALWNGNNPVPLQLNDTITAANAILYINGSSNNARNVEVRLYCSSNAAAYAYWGPANLPTNPPVPPALPTAYNFNLTLVAGGFAFPATCNTPNFWVLQVFNRTGIVGRTITVVPVSGANRSVVNLTSSNVIDVNSVTAYSTAYPGVTIPAYFTSGNTVYLRAVVSDPFGSFDINANPHATRPTITIQDSNSTTVVSNAAMTQVADSGAATKTFEYAYTPVPATGPAGWWTVTVTAPEGTEGAVSDSGIGTFNVVLFPSITIVKSFSIYSDPINGTTSPKIIPGSEILYTITAVNSGPGAADANSTVLTDAVPANTTMYVDTGSGDPVTFSCSAFPAACGLTFNYGANVRYTNTFPLPALLAPPNVCGNFSYAPSGSYDANVRGVCINPSGIFNGAGGGNPSFNVFFRMRVN
ncbi:MAG: hypothetical protein AABZ15_07030 [Nitrospirota bacterium]